MGLCTRKKCRIIMTILAWAGGTKGSAPIVKISSSKTVKVADSNAKRLKIGERIESK